MTAFFVSFGVSPCVVFSCRVSSLISLLFIFVLCVAGQCLFYYGAAICRREETDRYVVLDRPISYQ